MTVMEQIVAVLVLWGAGTGLFFYLVNRWLLFTRDFRLKTPAMGVAFLLLAVGGVWHGWHAGFSPVFWVALFWLVLQLVGELQRLRLRRVMAGAPPVWQENVEEPLMQLFTTTTLATRHYEISVPNWRGPRLRVALVTDLHLNGMLPDSHYRLVLERVQEAAPDLIFLLGDFVSDEPGFAAHLTDLLGDVHGKHGAFAILGNHDYWADPVAVRSALTAAGVAVIGNGVHRLVLPGGTRLAVWGCEDPWGATHWQPPERQDGELVLALSHTADNIYRLAHAGAHAVFCGHYHAGQWRLPGVGPLLVPSRFGRRFDRGHFVVSGAHLFVSAGVGITRIPFRIYCRPDIFIVDILPGN